MRFWMGLFCLLTLPALASDFVSFPDNRAVQLSRQDSIQVINFWATYCVPCRQEMPEMNRWFQKTRKKHSINMVGIALDSEENVRTFLRQTPVQYRIWRYVGKDSRTLMKSFGNKIGVLPYTVVRLPKCGKEKALTGKITETLLNQTLNQLKQSCSSF